MNLRELIDELEDFADSCGDQTEVRLAQQPSWPFEYAIGDGVAVDSTDDEEEEKASAGELVVYIGENQQIGYLPGAAARALGWSKEKEGERR